MVDYLLADCLKLHGTVVCVNYSACYEVVRAKKSAARRLHLAHTT